MWNYAFENVTVIMSRLQEVYNFLGFFFLYFSVFANLYLYSIDRYYDRI